MDKRQRRGTRSAPVRDFLDRFQFGRRCQIFVNGVESGAGDEICQLDTDDFSLKKLALRSTEESSADLQPSSSLSAKTSNLPLAEEEWSEITYKRISPEEKEEKVITYERRNRTGSRKRKDTDEFSSGSQKCERDEKKSILDEVGGQTTSHSDMTGVSATKVAQMSVTKSSPSVAKNWSSLFGSQRTLAPKRIIGQYFLDLGQSDFSYSTCRTCGMLYAPGHENDEKVHQGFHRNYLQGIQFKGWRDERVASRIDPKGNRVIIVRAEETYQRTKVREVIQFMEVELGLTPGWLLQRSCTIYLFVSSAKKIVGCLMAERIQSAYKVVPDLVKSSGKDAKVTPAEQDASGQPTQTADRISPAEEDASRQPTQTAESSKPAVDDTYRASDERVSELAAGTDGTVGRKRCKTDEQATPMRPCPSGIEENSAGISDGKPIFVASTGHLQEAPAVKQEGSTSSFATVKEEPMNANEGPRKAKITDYFLSKTPRPGQRSCKSKGDGDGTERGSAKVRFTSRTNGKSQPSGPVRQEAGDFKSEQVHTEEKPNLNSGHIVDKKPVLSFEGHTEMPVLDSKQVHLDQKPIFDSSQVHVDQKPAVHGIIFPEVKEEPCSSHGEQNDNSEFKQAQMDEKQTYSAFGEVFPKVDEDLSRPNISRTFSGTENGKGKHLESQSGAFDGTSVFGGKDKVKVMLFGNVRFSRELAAPKRVKKEQLQDLGKAILRTTEAVPAICGVRAIWVSQSERRKGIATHLLDAMRKTFVLGISIGTSQFAFSQPTPEGRKFAEQYCRTNQFLVYTTT